MYQTAITYILANLCINAFFSRVEKNLAIPGPTTRPLGLFVSGDVIMVCFRDGRCEVVDFLDYTAIGFYCAQMEEPYDTYITRHYLWSDIDVVENIYENCLDEDED